MAARKVKQQPAKWRNRIVGSGIESPEKLLANPKNWRLHPDEQREALGEVLAKVGWVQRVVVNQQTGFVVDGHLRAAMAVRANEPVPVLYVDLSPAEEALILATFDPISALAEREDKRLDALLAELRLSEIGQGLGSSLDSLLKDLQGQPEGGAGTNSGADVFHPEIIKGGCVADLAPTEAERTALAGRKLLIEYGGGKDSSAAAIWARHYFPDNPTELMFVDLGADFVGFHLYLHDAARFLGVPLVILRSKRTVLDTMLEKGKWPHFGHPYCHENLHQPLDDYILDRSPKEIAILRGGRSTERLTGTKSNESRFLVVDRMKEYSYFQPLYFSDKYTSGKLLEEAGHPVWDGYSRGLCRTACRICPGQKRKAYAAIRANFPDVWSELLDLERRFGPGVWQLPNPEGGHFGFEVAADRGQEKLEKGK